MRASVLGMIGVVLATAGLAGCSSTGGATPINASAQQLGPISVAFVNTGGVSGPAQIIMANGEVLNGSFSNAALGGGLLSMPVGFVADSLNLGDGPVQIVASGPHTTIVCRGERTLGGNGHGKCQSKSGALWAVSW